ncbi:hypothetical protein LCGC14_0577020 [marine sediment metagenome]|uniref:Uncharacterized protein n=1 Tax=marine sediment metagenome TaxID=412755 RepID=A0A0F9RHJ3_9ZZZZ|nr:hypothetical protein [bacterium]
MFHVELTAFERIVVYLVMSLIGLFGIYIVFIIIDMIKNRSNKKAIKKVKPKEKIKSIKHIASKQVKKETDSIIKKAVLFKKPKLFDPLSWTSLKLWKNFIMDRLKLHKTVLIHMELNNGNWRSFLVVPEDGGFRYGKNFYSLDPDPDMKVYNMDAKHYQYWFHEAYSLPIKYKLPVQDVQKLFTVGEPKEIELSTNPSVLRKLIDSDMAEGVLSGTELHAFFKRVQVMIFIVMIIVALIFMFVLWQSGVLDNLAQIGKG